MKLAIFLVASLASFGLANPILPGGFGGSGSGSAGAGAVGSIGGAVGRLRPTAIRPLPTGIRGPIAGGPSNLPIRLTGPTTSGPPGPINNGGPIENLSVPFGTAPEIQPVTDAVGNLASTVNTVREILNQLLTATDVDEILRLANLAKDTITAGLGAQITLGDFTASAGVGAGVDIKKREPETGPEDVLQAILSGILEIIANPDPATVEAKVQDLLEVLDATVLPAVGQLIGGALGVVLGLAGSALNILGNGGGLGGLGDAGGLVETAGNLAGGAGGGFGGFGNFGGVGI